LAAPNFVRGINESIRDFVEKPENSALIRGTGYYSTPFRGDLFGASDAQTIADLLETRSVEMLWLGMNPNVPNSIEQIVNPAGDRSDYPSFQLQLESTSYSSLRWDAQGVPSSDWNPLQRREGNWALYRDAIAGVADIEAVTMINFLPWGSANAREYVQKLRAFDSELLTRTIHFANELTREILGILKPRILVVPFSLARDRNLNEVVPLAFSIKEAKELRPFSVPTRPAAFNYLTGVCLDLPTLYVRHPSSLRYSAKDRVLIEEALDRALEALI
jgi:hypothetical protein